MNVISRAHESEAVKIAWWIGILIWVAKLAMAIAICYAYFSKSSWLTEILVVSVIFLLAIPFTYRGAGIILQIHEALEHLEHETREESENIREELTLLNEKLDRLERKS